MNNIEFTLMKHFLTLCTVRVVLNWYMYSTHMHLVQKPLLYILCVFPLAIFSSEIWLYSSFSSMESSLYSGFSYWFTFRSCLWWTITWLICKTDYSYYRVSTVTHLLMHSLKYRFLHPWYEQSRALITFLIITFYFTFCYTFLLHRCTFCTDFGIPRTFYF